MLNFLEYSGSIIIDGIDIKKVPHQLLRERITTITQTPVVIDDSVRYNLVPWDENNEFPDSTINQTLQQLGLEEPIKSKGGLDASLESVGLSAAHLELLCIARAILHHIQTESKIVLMDEPTASLSAASDFEVQRVMKEVFQGCTVFSIAHWDSPLQQNDLELFIDKGMLENSWRLKDDEGKRGDGRGNAWLGGRGASAARPPANSTQDVSGPAAVAGPAMQSKTIPDLTLPDSADPPVSS